MREREPVGIYLHFPFCVRKCKYCDFLSGPSDAAVRHDYAEAMCREIRAFGREASAPGGETHAFGRKACARDDEIHAFGREAESNPENETRTECVNAASGGEKLFVDTIFLGGGTPSVMDPADLTRVMEAVRDVFCVTPDCEISMEMNPGTFREDLLTFVKTNINRVSLGLQSANDAELLTLGRIHTFAEFECAFRALREAGVANINVDLMSAIPGQTKESWESTICRVAGMGPEHLSCYSLIIEEGTPFYALYEAGKLDLPDEDAEREMYYMTERLLAEYGYRRYEISNYAKPGYMCRHNARYWRRLPYVGFGIGAASLYDETRWNNTRDIGEYIAGSGEPALIRREVTSLTNKERMEEFMFLGLRMTEGISAVRFAECFGTDIEEVYGDTLGHLVSEGLMAVDSDRYLLTPRGIDVSNPVLAKFLDPAEE